MRCRPVLVSLGLALGLALGLTAGCSSPASPPAGPGVTAPAPEQPIAMRETSSAALAAELDAIVTESGVAGAVAAVITARGELRVAASGLADREQGTPMTTDARMLAGSVGKMLVVAVTRTLLRQGTLAIDAPVATVLGSEPWYGRLPSTQVITLRHLLTHSSGILNHVMDERFAHDLTARLAAGELDWYPRPIEAVEYALDREPLFAPGQGYEYTDTGYIVIGLMIERVSGRPFYELARELVIEPLGLSRTAPSDRRALAGLVAGYTRLGQMFGIPDKVATNGVMAVNPALEWTGGGFISNPVDLAGLARRIFEAPDRDELIEGAVVAGRGRYGLGVQIFDTELGPSYGHSGWFPGYMTIVAYYPEHRLAVALQLNGEVRGVEAMAIRLARAALAESPVTAE